MKRLLIFVTLASPLTLAHLTLAQQNVTVSGVVQTPPDNPPPDETRVGIHVIDRDGNTLHEVASTSLVAGTFSVGTTELPQEQLQPFRSGVVPLPGLQTEYEVTPAEVNFARAVTKVYVDSDESESYTAGDGTFFGVSSLEGGGFFLLIYVDQATTLTGRNAEINFAEGWNVFAAEVEAGEGQNTLVYRAQGSIDNVILDVGP